MKTFCWIVALSGLIAGQALAVTKDAESKLEQFKSAHVDAQFYGKQFFDDEGFFEEVGTADTIFGTVLSTGKTPEDSAWNFYSQIEGIYAEEVGELVPGQQFGAIWDRTTQQHRFYTFRFHQNVDGIPVYRSGVGFLVRNEPGFPVVMSSNNLKEMAGFNADPNIPAEVTPVMLANTQRMLDEAPLYDGAKKFFSVLDGARNANPPAIQVYDEQLVIWAGVSNLRVQPEMAIVFVAERGQVSDPSRYQKQLVVAAADDGQILYHENQVSADVSGTVSGNITDGDAALECEPENPFALPYAEVQIVGGSTVFANGNGNFNIPSGAAGNVTVRSHLRGQWFEVFDEAASGSTPFIDVVVANGGVVNFLHNQSGAEFSTSNANCYFRANEVRDFVLSFEPAFPTIANQTSFNVSSNINDDCNAFYDGTSINMFRNAGSCNNTSIADVIYHEYGHHLVAVTGNGQGQFGEGSGDSIGVLIEDNPNLALGFFEGQCNTGIRNADNNHQYPCSGEIHDCGQLIAGCVWDCIEEIRLVDPSNARDITANLFIGMLIVRGQMTPGSQTIDPLITVIFLELDDTDGNINNGTPHYVQIANAFGAHNMDAPPLAALDISFPQGLPDIIDPDGGIEFEVEVAPITSTPVNGSGRLHVNNGGGFQQFPLIQNSATNFSASFPPTTCGTTVQFYVSFQAASGVTVTRPEDAPASSFSTISAEAVIVSFFDSFDTDTGWTISGNATDGQWERAIPNNGNRGDPPFDAEETGAGVCYVTDNGNTATNNNTDVDGGSTILTSPILDASVGVDQEAYLSYYRWYSNDFGGNPMSDVFVVDISNNGGSTWVNLETVGPTGPEVSGGWIFKSFRVADFIPPTNNLRVRFNASDLGGGSVVEAGVDAVQVFIVDCADAGVLLGDVNLDGFVNLLDVAPFVALLSSGGYQAEADINQDGLVNLLDVMLFVDLLGGG
jgi:hypothetical protein